MHHYLTEKGQALPAVDIDLCVAVAADFSRH